MKLLLTSAGLANDKIKSAFLTLFDKNPSESTALIVAYGQNEDENFYINKSKLEIENLGFMAVVLNMNDCPKNPTMPDFDVIYVCGGNTFVILKKMKELGLDEYIIKQVENGSVYIGVSAGSIIAGPSIEIAGWGVDADINEVGINDLQGLKFTDVSVFVHYEIDRHFGEVEDFKKKVSCPVVPLTNDQAIVINGDKIEYI